MRNYFYCEICGDEKEHMLIKEKSHLYRCKECGNYANFPPGKEISCRAIISFEGESERGEVKLKEGEMVEKGDELVVETESGFRIGEVTSLELKNGKRSDLATAEEVETVWLRDVGEVAVRISLHKRAVTTPITIYMPGESELRVGEELEIGNKRFRVSKIKTRDGRVVDRQNDSVMAKDIKRVYAKFERKIRK